MDVILEIMRADNPVAEHPAKWRAGECVGVREATPKLLAALNGISYAKRTAFLVLTDLPARITSIEQVRDILECMDWKDDTLKDRRPPQGEDDVPFAHRRRWRLDFNTLTVAQAAALTLAPRYLTMPWSDVMSGCFINRKTGAPLRDGDI